MNRRGFSLLEVVVAMGILALGIGGVMAIFVAATAAHRQALEETTAAIIADTVIAEQRAAFGRNRYSDPVEVKEQPVPGYDLYTVSVMPTVLEREPETSRPVQVYLEVTVHYQNRGVRRRTVYRTILFRE
jgi:prepilin-type N-terminal cleavage/methylation domain-containing protein